MDKLESLIRALSGRIEKYPKLVPMIVIEPVKSFGERALVKQRPRAGTAVCLTDCYFATVNKESYMKLLRRVELDMNH